MLVAVARGDLSLVDIETWYRDRLGRPHPGRRRRVPGIKFTTNDGWLVTAPECRILADGLETRGATAIEVTGFNAEAGASWHKARPVLVRYFRRCARADGLRVW